MLLLAHPVSVTIARGHVTRVLAAWEREDLVESVRLVTSELVTNAIKATKAVEEAYGMFAGGDRRVWVGVHQVAAGVVVEVWDRSRTPPKPRTPEEWDVGGRGLQVVNELATTWGYRWPKTGGKVVWALLSASP